LFHITVSLHPAPAQSEPATEKPADFSLFYVRADPYFVLTLNVISFKPAFQ
jgi:hypothetical protein